MLNISRIWAMPSADTFGIPPIADLLTRYVSGVVVDPFARNSSWGTITNDLNSDSTAQFHLEATDFCQQLVGTDCQADVVLFDPPYSPRQISECYKRVGLPVSTTDTQNARLYKSVRDGLDNVLKRGGLAISFGWNSAGFGLARGYDQIEILLVAHGGAHNDTIVTVERKR